MIHWVTIPRVSTLEIPEMEVLEVCSTIKIPNELISKTSMGNGVIQQLQNFALYSCAKNGCIYIVVSNGIFHHHSYKQFREVFPYVDNVPQVY